MSKETVRRVVLKLGQAGYDVRIGTVYGWLRGRNVPKPKAALALTQISRGKIRLEDVYRHAAELERVAAKATPAKPDEDGRSSA